MADAIVQVVDGRTTVEMPGVPAALLTSASAAAAEAVAASAGVTAALTAAEAARDDAIAATADFEALKSGRTAPHSDFSWAGILPTLVSGPGQVTVSETAVSYARRVHAGLLGGNETIVDPINGNDSNGGSITSPVKTINAALDKAPSTIYCIGGEGARFDRWDWRNTDTYGSHLKHLIAVGRCVVATAADNIKTVTWTLDDSSTWYCSLTGANSAPVAVVDERLLDAWGQPTPLVKYASLANLKALTAGRRGGWFHDDAADRLYVRYGSQSVEAYKANLRLITGGASSTERIYNQSSKLAMSGLWVFEGTTILHNDYGGARGELYFDLDTSEPNIVYSPLEGLNNLGSLFVGTCWIHRSKNDNFHPGDGLGTNNAQHLEINCISTRAGDIETHALTATNTQNGSSMHDGGSVIRYGGRCEGNYGPAVVDTGTGRSWNVGVAVKGSAGDAPANVPSANDYGFYAVSGLAQMWLDTCEARDFVTGDVRADTTPILTYRTGYRTSSTAGGGSITEYTPS